MPSATTQMDGEGIMLSEKSQIETNTIVSPICGFLKNTYICVYIHRERERERENKLMIAKGKE